MITEVYIYAAGEPWDPRRCYKEDDRSEWEVLQYGL